MSISCGDVAPIKEPLNDLVVKYVYMSYLHIVYIGLALRPIYLIKINIISMSYKMTYHIVQLGIPVTFGKKNYV